MSSSQHLVAIIGRPNVGKSTLFNRLVGGSKAITTPEAGGTRDRNYDIVEWNGRAFTLIDTGGYLPGDGENFEAAIREQITMAIEESHLIIFLLDCHTELLADDHLIADLLRKCGKPVILVANKADNPQQTLTAATFHALGLGEAYPISAIHGKGTGDLLDAMVDALPPQDSEDALESSEEAIPRLAFVGKPNAGKSTLMNALLGKPRSIVSARPHTTRDTIHSHYRRYQKDFLLVDTAGIYRKNKKKEDIAFYSVIRSIKAIQQSDVCILLVSAQEGLTKQDREILSLAQRHKKGIVLVINKWDLVDKTAYDAAKGRKAMAKQLGNLAYVPILFTSALHKTGIYQLLEKAQTVYDNRKRHIPNAPLMDLLQEAMAKNPHPMVKGKRIKIKYATQVPLPFPAFALFANLPQYITATYKSYLTNQLRARFDFEGAPIVLLTKKT